MNIYIFSTLLSIFLFASTDASAISIRKKRNKNKDKVEIVSSADTTATNIDTYIAPIDSATTSDTTILSITPQVTHILSTKDTISDNDIVLPEGLSTGVDTLITEEQPNLQPPSNRKGDNIDYPDSVYINRLRQLPTIIDLPYNKVVKEYITLYTDKRRELVEKLLALNIYYEPIFEAEIDKVGMPLELKYLPVIESALRPNAVSRVGAAGLWQFMIGTARMMGLEVNSIVDERRDPVKSTKQALRYLQQLHRTFGDWTLAIAAYNCGPGNVNKAIRRAGGKRDYWDIYPYLPRETRGYVPAFIAANYVMNYYDAHNIQPGEIELPTATDTVIVSKRLHFKQIADVLHIDIEEIRRLNPQYRRDVIPSTSKTSYALILPEEYAYEYAGIEDSIANYQSALYAQRITAEINTAKNIPVQGYHRVRSGENLSVIAHRYRTSVANLRKWNNLKSNNIYPGMKLIVNSSVSRNKKSSSNVQKANKTSGETWIKNGIRYYKVRSGDNLWDISRKFTGVTVQQIKTANSLKSNSLKPGQILRIP